MTAAITMPCWRRRSPLPTIRRWCEDAMPRGRAESSRASAFPAAWSRRGGNSSFEPLLNPKNETTTWMEGCQIKIDAPGRHRRDDGHDERRAGARDAALDRGRRDSRARPRKRSRGARGFAGGAAEQQPGRQPHGDHAGRGRRQRRAETEGAASGDRGEEPGRARKRTLVSRRRCRARGGSGAAHDMGCDGR